MRASVVYFPLHLSPGMNQVLTNFQNIDTAKMVKRINLFDFFALVQQIDNNLVSLFSELF